MPKFEIGKTYKYVDGDDASDYCVYTVIGFNDKGDYAKYIELSPYPDTDERSFGIYSYFAEHSSIMDENLI